ncbi:MAG: SMP-30/gluconolactonase/LRE family protein [Pyrinomonadaceae bacterium]|nr:SMP-30/gluconolactonase/LRE family protein [Pyrinomonadaceae bacterium]
MFFYYSASSREYVKSVGRCVDLAIFAAVVISMTSCTVTDAPQIGFPQRVVTVAGKAREIEEPFGIAERNRVLFVSDGGSGRIMKVSADGSISTFAAGLDTPSGIAFGPDGRLYVADAGTHTIKAVDENGSITTVAGTENVAGSDDGPAASATFRAPVGIAVADDGKVFVADSYNDRIRVIEAGVVRTLAGSVKGFADGRDARFDTPLGLAMWKDGRVIVADSGNRRLRAIEPDGSTWTLAGKGPDDSIDGIPAESAFVKPTAISVSATGIIYIADGNSIRVLGRRQFPIIETISETRRGLSDGIALSARFNRPSGIAVTAAGDVYVADSDNQLVRRFTSDADLPEITADEIAKLRYNASEFRQLSPGRWPYDPPGRTREIAGTLGEIRGEIVDSESQVWFHNGLDIVGGYGETATFVRDEKVLDPAAVENFETLRELIRMPTMGYIHINIGRTAYDRPFGDPRFLFEETGGRLTGVRVPRGTKFRAGEPIGTLNALNHVHLIAGRPGAEMNALDALILPGVSDAISPVIESASFFDQNWQPIETVATKERIKITGRVRISVRAYDRKDGNAERRRLAPYKLGWAIGSEGSLPAEPERWNITFERMPVPEAVKFAYAVGSRSGATGETRFNFAVTNIVDGYRSEEGFLDTSQLAAGPYTVRVYAVDFFGNLAVKDIPVEVVK